MAIKELSSSTKQIGVLVLIVGFVLAILQGLVTGGSLGSGTAAENAVNDGIDEVATIVSWIGIVVLIIVGAYLFKRMEKF